MTPSTDGNERSVVKVRIAPPVRKKAATGGVAAFMRGGSTAAGWRKSEADSRAGKVRRAREEAAAHPSQWLGQAFGLVTMTFQLPGTSLAVSVSLSMLTDLIGAGATVFGASLVFTAFMLG